MKLKLFLSGLLLSISPLTLALGDCEDQQNFCEAKCEVRHLSDDAAVNGCYAKCTASRAVCSTKEGAKEIYDAGGEGAETVYEAGKEGAETVIDAGKDAVDSTKSFIKGLLE